MPRNLNTKTAILGALSAFALMSANLTARAAEPSDVPQRVVRFGDLDLTRTAGVAALLTRIQSAAKEVCLVVSADLGAFMRSKACAAQATERAIAAVNAPLLTSYYLAKSKAGRAITVAQRD
jgi:UrcA family protein